jgi:hypothetical protein
MSLGEDFPFSSQKSSVEIMFRPAILLQSFEMRNVSVCI